MSDEGSVEIDNDELVSAVRIGDIPRITRLVAEGCDVGYVDDYERTSLLWAVDGGDEKVVECLFKLSADVSCTTPAGSTVLHLAVGTGSLPVMQMLLDRGVDVCAKDNHGMTPLHQAVQVGNADAVKFLVKAIGATSSGGDSGLYSRDGKDRTALQLAKDVGAKGDIVAMLTEAEEAQSGQPRTHITPAKLTDTHNVDDAEQLVRVMGEQDKTFSDSGISFLSKILKHLPPERLKSLTKNARKLAQLCETECATRYISSGH